MAPPPARAGGPDLEASLVSIFEAGGFKDEYIGRIIFGETAPHLTTEGERYFLSRIREILLADKRVQLWGLDEEYPQIPDDKARKNKMMTQFAMMNVFKVARAFGLKWGPDFIDFIGFPIWRPTFWNTSKIQKYMSFVGIAPAAHGNTWHPYDMVISSRYHNCVMVQETPVPEVHAGEDYVAHHTHGLHMLAKLMTLSFIDIDSIKRTFRFYAVQGCSRLYSWDELDDPDVANSLRCKIMVKGRVPRTKDFALRVRDGWGGAPEHVGIERAQAKIIAALPVLQPLLPIKMHVTELVPRCIIDIAPIVVAQFLDGRSGMSYGFLAYQLPTGPVESCSKVTVLVTRSGCDKQNPHPNDDWILLSFDPETIALEVSKALEDITSPSFDSWLILGQAATNVSLARRFKAAGRSRKYVDMVEREGVAISHFHGFVPRGALPANVAFFGQDRLPLPCGSIESALLTMEEKAGIADKVLALDRDIDYAGDIHVEPDHGCVISASFEMMERIAKSASFGLQHFETYKCDAACACRPGGGGGTPARSTRSATKGRKQPWMTNAYAAWSPEGAKPEA